MNKRVYGVLGIASIMANWNADFSGYPKATSSGEVFGSDKAFKYPVKKMWNDNGEKVLYIKSMDTSEKDGAISLIPRSLSERYQQLFGNDDYKDVKKVLKNLFNAVDVKNFGATFAEKGINISITGAVQLGQGFNKYKDTMPQEQQILSPFRDPSAAEKKGEEAKSTTLGTKIVSDEAHYFYPFSINPKAYKEFMELGVTDGYTEENYLQFRQAALTAATSFATNAKAGCENEFGFFVETKEDAYIPDLCKYIEFTRGEDGEKNRIDLSCGELLAGMQDRILEIQIYYNPYTTVLTKEIEGAKCFNIFTGQAI